MEIQGQIKSCWGHPVGMRGDLCLWAANGHSVPFVKQEREEMQKAGEETEPAPGAGALHDSEAGFLDKWYHPRAWDERGKRLTAAPECCHFSLTLWQVAMQPFLRLITGRESTFNPSVWLSEEVSVFMFP